MQLSKLNFDDNENGSNNKIIRLNFNLTILFLLICAAFGVLVLLVNSTQLVGYYASAGPVLLLIIVSFAAYRLLGLTKYFLMTPLLVFLISNGLYHGFGALVNIYGNNETLKILELSVFNTDHYSLVKASTNNMIFLSSVLIGVRIFCNNIVLYKTTKNADSINSLIKRWHIFLLIGFVVQYCLILPKQYGWHEIQYPALISNLSKIVDVALGMFFYVCLSKRKLHYWILFTVLGALHLSFVVLEFSKSSLIVLIIFLGVFHYLYKPMKLILLLWGLVAIIAFNLVNPIVANARVIAINNGYDIDSIPFQVRLSLLVQDNLNEHSQDSSVQREWMRLNYAPQQAYAINSYDNGVKFDSLRDVFILIVPRIFWPDKPSGLGPGLRFYQDLTGNESTRVGITIQADSYWNGGYVALVLTGILAGVLIGFMTKENIKHLQRSNFAYMPVVLFTMLFASKSFNTWILNGLLGSFLVYFSLVILIKFLSNISGKYVVNK